MATLINADLSTPASPRTTSTRIPSWSLIGTLDHVIPPALQEQMSKRAGAHITRTRPAT